MSGFKDFADGNVFTAAEVDGYLMRQAVMRFATTSDLTANLPNGIREHGMLAHAADTDILYAYSSALTAWVPWESPNKTFVGQGSSGGTNWTYGTSSQFGAYRYSAGMIRWNWRLTLASGVNLQSGVFAINLPVNVHANLATGVALGPWSFYDLSATTCYTRVAVTLGNAGIVAPVDAAGVRHSTTVPTALAIGDVLSMNLGYLPTETTWLT